jgi:hypothetical protein
MIATSSIIVTTNATGDHPLISIFLAECAIINSTYSDILKHQQILFYTLNQQLQQSSSAIGLIHLVWLDSLISLAHNDPADHISTGLLHLGTTSYLFSSN